MNDKKILIIEDDISIKDNITDLLEINGYKVFSAINGIDGIKLAREIVPDLILCDVMMPKLDGFKVKEKLSEDKNFAMIPFVFLTAKTEYTNIRKGMNLGADDYITKPFENKELVEVIELRLKKHEDLINNTRFKTGTGSERQVENRKILVTIGKSQQFLEFSSIVYIKSLGNYSRLYTDKKEKITVRRLLKQWEKLLPENEFFRIHQSYIINLSFVKKIEHFSKHSYVAKMNVYNETLPVSARYSQKLRSQFSLT